MSVAPNRSPRRASGREVHGDQPLGARDSRLAAPPADPTESDHRHAGAGPYLRRLDRRTDPRGDAAAEEARAPQRELGRHRSPAPREPRCARRACRARGCLRAARRLAPGGHGEAAATRASSDEARRADTVRTYRTGPPMPARRGRPREACPRRRPPPRRCRLLVAEEHREGPPSSRARSPTGPRTRRSPRGARGPRRLPARRSRGLRHGPRADRIHHAPIASRATLSLSLRAAHASVGVAHGCPDAPRPCPGQVSRVPRRARNDGQRRLRLVLARGRQPNRGPV